ncbi:1577_t:CDS:2 [Diversispora eburnea]|uniref:ATP synthase subunit d, mitochondrial n=1 Tax=Diversispora eburnea TaxID=1213867 RepID=A0A9N8V0L1_9GLOM|nr:1577_t:CDS:2 [Diversispora eburnea]
MAAAARSAIHSIDWPKLTVSLGLQKETILALQAFRKRNEEARRALAALKEQKTQVNFEHYRTILKNKGIVNEAENALNSFKPTKVDLDKQLKIIETFEEKAVKVVKAKPEIVDIVEKMVKKHRWAVPGYEETYGY